MRKVFFIAIMVIAFLSQHVFSQTKIRFVNNTNELVSAAYVKYIDETDGWKSIGWFNIKVGASMDINLGDYGYSNIYIYGYNKSNYWGKGQYQFCVDTKNSFSIANADANCDLTKKTFSEFKITSNKVNTWNFGVPKNNTSNNKTSQTIIIYTIPGCGICEHALEYMNSNNIKYKEMDLSKAGCSDDIWGKLQATGRYNSEDGITGPVFIKNGQVYFNLENIDSFLATLKN
jgi:glutaredoxin/uncharacterized membrane protein